MKKTGIYKKLLALVLALALCLPILGGAPKEALAAKAKIDSFYSKITIVYNSEINSKLNSAAIQSLESIILNRKKNAVYSIKIKNTKVAKSCKNKNYYEDEECAHIIYSTGIGSTTGVVYEQVGKKKKTKVGTVKIKVKKGKLGESVYYTLDRKIRNYIPSVVSLSPYMGKTSFDFTDRMGQVLNNKDLGVQIKKSAYTMSYKISCIGEDEKEIPASEWPVTINNDGVASAVGDRLGEVSLSMNAKFKDGSVYSNSCSVAVIKDSINREGKYNLNNIRDYIVGINTKVPVTVDGVEGEAVQICFDNAATTPAFRPVEDEVHDKLEMYGSIGRGFSEKSNYSTELYESTRNKVLDFLGADHTDYTCFYTNSTTDGLNKLASALITSKKDVVLTTRIEHHANDLSWRERCKVIYAEVDKKGRVKYSDIEKLLKKNKVKIVSVSAASNVTGYVSDIHKVAKLAHKYGAMIVADGAQIVAHRKFSMIGDPVDESDDVDFIAFSAHKMYSPFGGGAVVGKARELYKHMPTFYGGGTVQIVADDWVDYKQNDVAVYEAGSPNYPGVVGLGKAIDVISDVGFDAIQKHEKELNQRVIDGLKKVDPNVILYGDCDNIDDRVGVITFNFKDINTLVLAEQLSNIGAVATRRGQFCAHPYVWRLMGISDSDLKFYEGCSSAKTPGMIRVSFGIYNTDEEVDKFLEILPKAMEVAKEEQKEMDVVPEF